jgi:putative ABC transport system permease protein
MYNGTIAINIIGIMQDFNFESLKKEIRPLAVFYNPDNESWQYNMTIRLTPGNVQEKVTAIKNVWKKYSSAPFEYSFMDENFKALYNKEERLSNIVIVFTSLAVIIASLGLLGLVTFMAHQRTKEIGVRKVLGASVKNIVVLLSRDFIRLILIAFLIAIPLSWYATEQWLQDFASRIDFDFIIVAASGGVGVLIALLTVSYQSIKAAIGNPVESLRSE